MEQYRGEKLTTAVYDEERCNEHDLSKIGNNLHRIYGEEVDAKEWKVGKGDPFKLTRYQTEESDIFIASLRHNKTPDAIKDAMGVDERIETVYVFEDGVNRRLACFRNEMVDENFIIEQITELYDQQSRLSVKDFDAQLATCTERLRETKRGQERMMVKALQTQTESTATLSQAKQLNDLLRVIK